MNQTNIVMLAILVALGIVGSSLITILPSVYAQSLSSSSAPRQAGSPPTGQAGSNSQGSANACPPGTTSFSQGVCTITTTTPVPKVCPTGIEGIVSGPDTSGKCTVTFDATGLARFRDACNSVGGTFDNEFKTCNNIPAVCPAGSVPQGNECVITTTTTTRPGQGNQP